MSGFLIQSRFGNRGNFEVILPASDGGLVHLSRNNDVQGLPWSKPIRFGGAVGQVSGASIIQARDVPSSLEAVAVAGDQLLHFSRAADGGWGDASNILGSVRGIPALAESAEAAGLKWEVIVPAADRGLLHVAASLDRAGPSWGAPTSIGASLGQFSGACLIAENPNDADSALEVVATPESGGRFVHFSRNSAGKWSDATIVHGQIFHGGPSLIRSQLGTQMNLEVVVPNDLAIGLSHYWRDNTNPSLPWKFGATFGKQTQFVAVALIESNFGTVGNLEVVAATMFWRRVYHFSRNDNADGFPWSDGILLPGA